MSPSEIRRRALLAAAKVSFSLLAMGCGAADAPPSTPLDQRTGQPSCEPLDALCGGAGSSAQAGASPVESAGGAASVAGASGAGTSSGVGGASGAGASPGVGGASSGAGGEVAAAGAGQGGGPGCGEDTEFPYEAAQVNCCLGVVKATFPQDPGAPPPETISAEELACCRVVLTSRDKQDGTPIAGVDPIPWDIAYACCPFTEPSDGSFSPTCTPWGPPTPPEMQAWLLADRSWLAEVA
jgi:hypothetical protein